jgi:hypothetical protein
MREFESPSSYQDFAYSVTHHSRYVRTDQKREFLEAILDTAQPKVEMIGKPKVLFRAQLGNRWRDKIPERGEIDDFEQVVLPFSAKRMLPLSDRAHEGRANPKGIPVVYAATNANTAIAEVRPWVGSYVSVAALRPRKELRVVNCALNNPRRILYSGSDLNPTDRSNEVWHNVNEAFSRPVSRNDDQADYVPTQIIAELFRLNGFDGIAYESSLGAGHNLALFDLNSVRVAKSLVFRIEEVELRAHCLTIEQQVVRWK